MSDASDSADDLAGRAYARVYRVSNARADLHAFVLEAVAVSGAEVIFASEANRAPVFVGVRRGGERLGLLCYPFRCNPAGIRGRSPDEHRMQIRYGGEKSWIEEDHPLARDIAGVDTTLIVGVHLTAQIFVGLDPALYDPLPMGISVEFKDADVVATTSSGWHAWERDNLRGTRRASKSREGLETVIGFAPARLLDYVRFEREATALGLDPPLRYRAALAAKAVTGGAADPLPHALEREFDLAATEVLEIIKRRKRLAVAVRGGVAEHHLMHQLLADTSIGRPTQIDEDGRPDVAIERPDGSVLLVECKNVSPNRYSDGAFRVEVQKTRASKGDPSSRLYRFDQFGILAACLFSATGTWEFRYRRASLLTVDKTYPERIAPYQRVDDSWGHTIGDALAR